MPRRLSAGWVYSLPHSPVLGFALNHWQLSGNLTLQDGNALENPVYFCDGFQRELWDARIAPNIVPGQSILLPANQRNANQYYNPNAISAPAPFTFGDAGRDILPSPGSATARRFSSPSIFL